jgi:hypothetical protein
MDASRRLAVLPTGIDLRPLQLQFLKDKSFHEPDRSGSDAATPHPVAHPLREVGEAVMAIDVVFTAPAAKPAVCRTDDGEVRRD